MSAPRSKASPPLQPAEVEEDEVVKRLPTTNKPGARIQFHTRDVLLQGGLVCLHHGRGILIMGCQVSAGCVHAAVTCHTPIPLNYLIDCLIN